jgi:hypothetical protein
MDKQQYRVISKKKKIKNVFTVTITETILLEDKVIEVNTGVIGSYASKDTAYNDMLADIAFLKEYQISDEWDLQIEEVDEEKKEYAKLLFGSEPANDLIRFIYEYRIFERYFNQNVRNGG